MAKKQAATKVSEPTLASILAKRGGKYLSETEKQEFAEASTAFTISKIVKNKGSYGTRWELTIKVGNKDRALTIPTHAARDETMDALRSLIDKKGAQGPVSLTIREMDNGNTWLSIAPVKAAKKGDK